MFLIDIVFVSTYSDMLFAIKHLPVIFVDSLFYIQRYRVTRKYAVKYCCRYDVEPGHFIAYSVALVFSKQTGLIPLRLDQRFSLDINNGLR